MKAEKSISHPQSWNTSLPNIHFTSNSLSSANDGIQFNITHRRIHLNAEYIAAHVTEWLWCTLASTCHAVPFPMLRPENKMQNLMTYFFEKGKVRKVMCWSWKISVFHWCQLAIHSHDNVHVLDSDSSYTWMIMRWWVWASVCHETSMTEW